MPNTNYVSVAKPKATGGAAYASLGTPLPTDASTPLDEAIKAVGYVGDGGVKLKMDRKSEKFRAWGGKVVHTALTEFGETYTLSLIESANGDVLKAVFGEDNVTITPGPDGSDTKVTIRHNEADNEAMVWVFDMKAGRDRRIVMPNAKLSDIGDVTYSDKDLIAYDITLDALPDESGNTAYEYVG